MQPPTRHSAARHPPRRHCMDVQNRSSRINGPTPSQATSAGAMPDRFVLMSVFSAPCADFLGGPYVSGEEYVCGLEDGCCIGDAMALSVTHRPCHCHTPRPGAVIRQTLAGVLAGPPRSARLPTIVCCASASATPIFDSVHKAPADERSLQDWANAVGASSRTLVRLFQAAFGLSFRDWRQQMRLLAAIPLLAAGTPITKVAGDAGYDTPSAFSLMFRRVMGMTPRQYLSRY
ncbi:hypothetical protein CJO94_05375 [Ralstonia solanacearum]|nr:hypothetical protein CJO94_05375 [Ralstonia solanacearum]